jgi:hypothetical protein
MASSSKDDNPCKIKPLFGAAFSLTVKSVHKTLVQVVLIIGREKLK